MFSRTSRLLSLLFLEFSGFYILFSFQGSLLFLNSNSFILSQLVVFVNNFFYLFFEALSNFRAALSDAYYIITGFRHRQALFLIFFSFFVLSCFPRFSQGLGQYLIFALQPVPLFLFNYTVSLFFFNPSASTHDSLAELILCRTKTRT